MTLCRVAFAKDIAEDYVGKILRHKRLGETCRCVSYDGDYSVEIMWTLTKTHKYSVWDLSLVFDVVGEAKYNDIWLDRFMLEVDEHNGKLWHSFEEKPESRLSAILYKSRCHLYKLVFFRRL